MSTNREFIDEMTVATESKSNGSSRLLMKL